MTKTDRKYEAQIRRTAQAIAQDTSFDEQVRRTGESTLRLMTRSEPSTPTRTRQSVEQTAIQHASEAYARAIADLYPN